MSHAMTHPHPMTKIQSLRRMLELAIHDRSKAGDIAVHKADVFFTAPTPELAERLTGIDPLIPRLEPTALRALEPGTFGRAYIDFLDANGLRPFVVSDEMPPEVLARTAHWARYAVVHDMFHVLLGYGPDPSGEAGVYAFTLAQRYALAFWLFLPLAILVLPLLAPHRIPTTIRNARRGFRLGRRLDCVLAQPLDHRFADGLEEVRKDLGFAS